MGQNAAEILGAKMVSFSFRASINLETPSSLISLLLRSKEKRKLSRSTFRELILHDSGEILWPFSCLTA